MPDLPQSSVGLLAFVPSLARALDKARVPCVLWGQSLLNLHGVPSVIASIDFVIPDDRLEAGVQALARYTGLVSCPDPQSCPKASQERWSPPPAFHAHFDGYAESTAELYVQSETLWFLPPMNISLLSPTSERDLPPYFALSSDRAVFPPWRTGRGSGVFTSAADAVVAPKAHVLLEAYMRLLARDHGKRVSSFGRAMICYMKLYVDADGFLDTNLLPEPLRTSYGEFQEGEKPMRQWIEELKDALGVVGDGS